MFKRKPKNILTYGTFDLYHYGHSRLLLRISEKTNGGNLFVGVSSDKWNGMKGKTSHQNEKERLEHIQSLEYVHKAFLEDHDSFEKQWPDDYKKYNIDLVIMGSDHEGKLDYLKDKYGIKIKYLSRTPGISSTQLREQLKLDNFKNKK